MPILKPHEIAMGNLNGMTYRETSASNICSHIEIMHPEYVNTYGVLKMAQHIAKRCGRHPNRRIETCDVLNAFIAEYVLVYPNT